MSKAIDELREVFMSEFLHEAARSEVFQARPEIEDACKVLFQDLAEIVFREREAQDKARKAKAADDFDEFIRHNKRAEFLKKEIAVASAMVGMVAEQAKLIQADQANAFTFAVSRCFFGFAFVASKIIKLGGEALAEGLTASFQAEMENKVREVFA